MAEKELILDIPLEHEMNILGDMDKYLRKLQRQFSVNIIDRDGLLKIIGEEENAEKTKEVLLSKTIDVKDDVFFIDTRMYGMMRMK